MPLTRGYVALVDDEDYDAVSDLNWYAKKCGNQIYAVHSPWNPKRRMNDTVLLHRFVTGFAFPLVDHVNGNGLDNRRSNLRPATDEQNGQNQKIGARNTSGYRGVDFVKSRGVYRARIASGRSRASVGVFLRPEDAARAYDAAARVLYGEYAAVNFPNIGERSARTGELRTS